MRREKPVRLIENNVADINDFDPVVSADQIVQKSDRVDYPLYDIAYKRKLGNPSHSLELASFKNEEGDSSREGCP